jgi:23S rRNA U2552 (ribose-2'-O)-methylase RlmE/FtsJ
MSHFGTQEMGLKRINQLFPSFDLIVDVGAAIGTWSKLAHKIWPGVEIMAIEPQPDFVKELMST